MQNHARFSPNIWPGEQFHIRENHNMNFSQMRPGDILFRFVVQSLNHVWLFATPRTAAHKTPLFTIYRSLLKFMFTKLVILSNHLILCHPLLLPSIFPSIRVFSNESVVRIRWPKSWDFKVLQMNIQGWFPLELTSLILQSKKLSKSLFQHYNLKARAQVNVWSMGQIWAAISF